jgi:cysteinyl-tRNA synthetase
MIFDRIRSLFTSWRRPGLYLHDTLSGEDRLFLPRPGSHSVRMYNCGPTVYGKQHIGNLSMFVFTDVLRRTLEYNGFPVKQVINITDVGHLSSDADEGEDKMSKGLKAEGLTLTLENMKLLGRKYADIFFGDLGALNIDTADITFPYASEYIPAQIAMVKTLEEKGYAYRGAGGVYYDTSRFADYGKLGNINIEGLRAGARVAQSSDKRSPTDFLLWKSDPELGWDSPWGKGFPGWHIECSAMINSCLGKQIDIHTGGIEHIPVHHNNEIAQSEAALGKRPLARFWMHRAHLQMAGSKIAKSEGNVLYLSDIIERGYHPLSLRYLFLGAHYRSASNFTWEALDAAQTALLKLVTKRISLSDVQPLPAPRWTAALRAHFNRDLDTAGALAVLWEAVKDDSLSAGQLLTVLLDADNVLGIGLTDPDASLKQLAAATVRTSLRVDEVPADIRALVEERDAARAKRDFARSDSLRAELDAKGYEIEDAATGVRVFRRP